MHAWAYHSIVRLHAFMSCLRSNITCLKRHAKSLTFVCWHETSKLHFSLLFLSFDMYHLEASFRKNCSDLPNRRELRRRASFVRSRFQD